MTTEDMPIPGSLNNVIRIDDERIKRHLDRIVRGTVEETLNSLLDVTRLAAIKVSTTTKLQGAENSNRAAPTAKAENRRGNRDGFLHEGCEEGISMHHHAFADLATTYSPAS